MYLFCVEKSLGAPRCWNGGEDILRWQGQGTEYIVQDFGKSACSEGCHVMSYNLCQAAFNAYTRACPGTLGPGTDDDNVERLSWLSSGGTPGCHVQMVDGEGVSWQFDGEGNSGDSCADEHHPLCIVNGTRTTECQVAENPSTECRTMYRGMLVFALVLVLLLVVLPPICFSPISAFLF